MADEHKGIALVILGIVAVIAIVGLVLLFTQAKGATGQGVYGGAIKNQDFPNWIGRGVPANIPGQVPGELWDSGAYTETKDMQSHWNYYSDTGKKNPQGDVPSAIRKCLSGGMLIGYSDNLLSYYQQRGYYLVETPDKAGVCVYPQTELVGGIA